MQFKDIIGHCVTANRLTKIIDSGRISHAQMFLGDTANGSLALALAYAQYLNCHNRRHYGEGDSTHLRADSCGQCPSCTKYQQIVHPDLHIYFPSATTTSVKKNPSSTEFQVEFRDFLEANKQLGTLDEWYRFIGIENKQGVVNLADAQDIVRQLEMKAYESKWKVVVVWMAEKMNTVAANTILKNLEEPYPGTLVLLVVENKERMLGTVLSRSQIVPIARPGVTESDVAVPSSTFQFNPEFATTYVTWMRQLFKLNMASLSSWVDDIVQKGREEQKMFLNYAQEAIHQCFLCNLAGVPLQFDFGDEKFNTSFPTMITERNIELLNNAFNEALFAVERNGYSKLVFMQLSFSISKALKKK